MHRICCVAHHWYRKRTSGVPNGLKDAVGTGNALLVYQQGQNISFGPVKETVAEQWATFLIHVHQPWRVALSVQI